MSQCLNISNRMRVVILAAMSALTTLAIPGALAGQGAQRMLYAVPNLSFIESPSGDSVVTINDASGSIATLQTAINNARSANASSIIVIHLLNGATYWVGSAGLVLDSQECLIGTGATIQATSSMVTVPLITIASGATNVSIAGGTLDAGSANIYGIYAPASSARVNIDKVTVRNCGQDCIQLNGNGAGTFDNEMTVTRCDVSNTPGHAGISIWNATQTVCVDNNCHNNSVGIWIGNGGYCDIANNTCESNLTGINCNSGSDNYIVNNTCNNNETGIYVGGADNLIVSDLLASNSVAGINSGGDGNIYCDNGFAGGNAVNFANGGSGDDVVAYQGSLNGSAQNYFYPPLIDDQHAATIVNGMGRYDLTDNSTGSLDTVQNEYNAAVSANPGEVIVLHLNGNYTVGANPLVLGSDTCVLLGGTIQITSATTAGCAITATNASYLSVSGGVIDGGATSPPGHGRNGIYFTGDSMFQIDAVTLQNFGNNTSRVGGSDVIRIDHGNTPRIITRCTINGGSARGIWLATGGPRDIVSDNAVSDVQMDGVDCDESTSASVVKFNRLESNSRYGVFLEQSASYNLVLGNICNYNSSYDIGCYNNSSTPRGATAYNSVICNSLLGDNGLRNGSTGDGNNVTSSDNFYFNNTVMSANIQSQLYGTQNYYSQNYMGNSSLSTSGAEAFFNSPDVSGYLQVQDSDRGLDAAVQDSATTNGAPVVTQPDAGMANGEWQLVPTDSGYYQIVNANSGLAMVIQDAATNGGAPVIQYAYNASGNDEWMPVPAGNGLYSFINRLSGLDLDIPGAGTIPGVQLDQQPSSGAANQQFSLIDTFLPATASSASNGISWTSAGTPDGNWSDAANWGGVLPQAGDWIAFGSGLQLLTTNDLPPNTDYENILFSSAADSFVLNGYGLTLANTLEDVNGTNSGGTITDTSVNNQTINLPVTLSAGTHVVTTAGGAGQLNLNGGLLRSTGALAQFNVSGGAISNSGLANINGIVGGWAVYSPSASLVNNSGGPGAVDWATINSGNIGAVSSYTPVTGSGASIPNETGNNVKITTDGSTADTLSTSGVSDMNTLYFSANANNLQLNLSSGQTLRLGAQGGILSNSPRYATIGSGSSGVVTAGGGNNSTGELSLYNLSYYSGGGLAINATIKDNGSGFPVAVNLLGSVNYNFPNYYSGGTCINEGELYLQSGATCGSGPIYVFPGGRVDFGGNNGVTVTNSVFLAGYGFIVGGEPGAIKGSYNGTFSGALTLLGNAAIDPNAGTGTNTCNFDGPITGTGSLSVGGANSSYVAGTATFAGTNNYTGDTIIDASANRNGGSGIRIAGGKSNLMQTGGNLVLVGGSGGMAMFDLNGTTQNLNGLVATNGTPGNAVVQSSSGGGSLVVGGSGGSSTFNGIIQNGTGGLTLLKVGGGTLTLGGANTYTGGTIVSNGVLALSGSGSIADSASITVAGEATLDAGARSDQTFTLSSGQTLQGNGTINVNLTAAPGAEIAPGSATSLGLLDLPGEAQLQGTTVMKLDAALTNSDQLLAGSFNLGGTLTVTNLAGTLGAGQSFLLFPAGSYTGAFTSMNLPPLRAGLAWDTNNLAASGVLQVVSTVLKQPKITGIKLLGANLILNGINGPANQSFQVLAATNLALPLPGWTVIATNSFDASGNFNFTNVVDPGISQEFFLMQLQ